MNYFARITDAIVGMQEITLFFKNGERAVATDATGRLSESIITTTELEYLNGVTSNIQTQLNAKEPTITGAATTITSSNLAADRALISSGTGKVAVSATTSTELGYVSGVTSALQTQLGTKVPYSGATDAVDLNDKNLTNVNDFDADTAHLGGASDYTEAESTGFLVYHGEAQPWDDMQFDIASGRVAVANAPDWEAFTTNTSAYAFDVDDYIDLRTNEPPHGWAEGTAGSAHLHIALKTAQSTGSDRFAKFTLYLAIADVGEAFSEIGPYTAELTIPTGSAALHHFLLSLGTVTLTGKNIGLQAKARVKRIAATGGTEYADHIYITQAGIHLAHDTNGSRDISSK